MSSRYQFAGFFPTIIMGVEHGPDADVSRAADTIDGKARPADELGTTVVIEPGDFVTLPDDEILDPTLFVPVPASAPKKSARAGKSKEISS